MVIKLRSRQKALISRVIKSIKFHPCKDAKRRTMEGKSRLGVRFKIWRRLCVIRGRFRALRLRKVGFAQSKFGKEEQVMKSEKSWRFHKRDHVDRNAFHCDRTWRLLRMCFSLCVPPNHFAPSLIIRCCFVT